MILTFLMTMMLTGSAPEMMVPEGTVIPVVLNEKLSTNNVQEGDPILFSMAEDIRAAGRRGVVLIPRGSTVVGRIVRTDRAGHFIGRAKMDIRMEKIVTPDGDVYDGLTSKIVDINKTKGEKGQVKSDGQIQGPVHRKRDAFFLVFPPTTLFQLMALPGRGPDVTLPPETRLYVKLMTPIYVERQTAAQVAPMPLPAPAGRSMAVPPPAAVPAPVPVSIPQYTAPATVVIPQYTPAPTIVYLSWQELDRLVSPVALYPDSVLYHVLAACNHPDEILRVAQTLPQAGMTAWIYPTQRSADPSVQALSVYPDLLRRMSGDLNWVSSLGQAYRAQPNDVLNAVQRLRQQARGFRGM
jgi:hypothetical protein